MIWSSVFGLVIVPWFKGAAVFYFSVFSSSTSLFLLHIGTGATKEWKSCGMRIFTVYFTEEVNLDLRWINCVCMCVCREIEVWRWRLSIEGAVERDIWHVSLCVFCRQKSSVRQIWKHPENRWVYSSYLVKCFLSPLGYPNRGAQVRQYKVVNSHTLSFYWPDCTS